MFINNGEGTSFKGLNAAALAPSPYGYSIVIASSKLSLHIDFGILNMA
jgi:hypothetical protein